ncbi:MAG: YbaN family protein [Spirochaetes bacterium]|jgi:uncharacterized membrane protein YbaN (DUF454 family)|nr:YbaN family protein [Spirochaetota bacterium]
MKRIFLITIGAFSVLLGLIGIIIPGLPTTPFLLLASYCFLRSSHSLYVRLHSNRITAQYIKPFTTYKAISLKGKVMSIVTMWAMMTISMIFFISSIPIRIVISLCGVSVSIYIARFPTLTDEIRMRFDNNAEKPLDYSL